MREELFLRPRGIAVAAREICAASIAARRFSRIADGWSQRRSEEDRGLLYHLDTDRRVIESDALRHFCLAHRVRRLALFGSVLRGEAGPESDVALLVEFEPDVRMGLIFLAELELELSRLLRAKIDLRMARDLSERFRPQGLAEAEVLHAAA